jgi:hypothetical protein
MAERRMFAKTVIDSDAFLDMPMSTQALYFHLAMRADDDGFINNSKRIQRMIGASDDDFKVLIAKQFIIPFETGVIVIKHWKMHNYIQKDRYKPTIYEAEKETLLLDKKGVYTKSDTECIQDVYNSDTQDRLGKDRLELGKDKEKKERKTSFDDAISEYTSNDELKSAIVEFIKMRKLIKAPMTDRALKGIFNELDKLGHNDKEKIAILEQSIVRSWRGVFAISKPKQEPKQEEKQEEKHEMTIEEWAGDKLLPV